MPRRDSAAPTPPDGLEFLTIPEVAKRLRIKPRTVHRRIAEKRLPVHRFGRAVRISVKDLERYIAENRRF